MKLISWNCQGAFRKKTDVILSYKPDILIVQECEEKGKIFSGSTGFNPTDSFWYGDSNHKGIGVFSFNEYTLALLDVFNPEYRYVLPFRVTGNGQSFTLFAIWAMDNKENWEARYIGQVWLAINYYSDLLGENTILMGDFNSNKIWDYKDRVGNHSDVVRFLENRNIHSVYHKFYEEVQGKETKPTFHLQKNKLKPYHIDYCFTTSDIYEKITSVQIGSYENWITYSDHCPFIVSFDI